MCRKSNSGFTFEFTLFAVAGCLFLVIGTALGDAEDDKWLHDKDLQTLPEDEPHTIANDKITDWGLWGSMDQCPFGTFAFAYQQRIAPRDPKGDNTALNAVKLFCSAPNAVLNYTRDAGGREVFSLVGQEGKWGPMVNCTDGDPLTGFALKVAPNKGAQVKWVPWLDDVAAIAFQGYSGPDKPCTNPEEAPLEYKDSSAKWTKPVFCEEGFVVCGIQTQIDANGLLVQTDRTGLNNIKLRCCDH